MSEAGIIGKNLLQRKNDYKYGGFFYCLLLALKKNVDKYSLRNEHRNFNVFSNVSEKFSKEEYIKLLNGEELIAKLPLRWKRGFDNGVKTAQKQGYLGDCKIDSRLSGS